MRNVIIMLVLLLGHTGVGAESKMQVITLSTVLTEIAEEVGGEKVSVRGLIKPGVDPHGYEIKPADLKLVSGSDLVLVSAWHLDGYAGKLKESTGTRAKLVSVGDGFSGLLLPAAKGHDHDHGHGHGHGNSGEDPHWWHSLRCMEKATEVVRDAMIAVRPGDRAEFEKNADAYVGRLEKLGKWAKKKVAELPKDQRKLVTSHDAFQYFAKENGFTVYAIEGITRSEQPSSKRVADLIKLIKEQRVKAIFGENLQNPKVLKEITKESGAKLGGELYADGLGTGEAATYEGMYRANVSAIVDALK